MGLNAERRPASLKWTAIAVAAVIGALVAFIALFDWNLARGPMSRLIGRHLDRPVRIDGDLRVVLLSSQPSISISDLTIGNPDWAGGGSMASIGRLKLQLRLLSLLKGQIVLPLVDVEKPDLYLYADRTGRANWEFGTASPSARSQPSKLPIVRRVYINQGHLRLLDEQRKLKFAATVSAGEGRSGSPGEPFELLGQGTLNEKPFSVKVDGGPLVSVEEHRPYPFDLKITASDIHAQAHGVVAKPFDLGRLEADLAISGQDLADGYYLTGLALPNTPPYQLSGRLVREGTRFEFRDFAGTVGASDLRGRLTVETGSGRPNLTGELRSRSLNFADLAAPLGSPPSRATEARVAGKDGKKRSSPPSSGPFLPTAPLALERIRAMDAQVRYRADSVQTDKLPLKAVELGVKLDHGLLGIDPVDMTLPMGKVAGTVRIDARAAVPRTDLDLHITNLNLAQFKPQGSAQPPLEGVLLGRLRAHGTGDSVHGAASTADGAFTAVLARGEVRAAFAELTGINLRGLGLLLDKSHPDANVRCGIADFSAQQGVLTTKELVFDTDDVLVTGKGQVDLRTEKIDISINGQPKKLRFVRVRAPILISGTLGKPAIGLKPGNALAQVGIAAALGALATPFAAIVAFVDPGLAKDANCTGLLAEAKREGAPLRTATQPGATLK
jgi:uncharacterized protein involved in outer membrane biogenesis